MNKSEKCNTLSPALSRREKGAKNGDAGETRESRGRFPLPAGEGKFPLDSELLSFARKLRKEATDAEQFMWRLLRNRRFYGFKFRRQHSAGKYALDFYCHEARLGVELDGGQHNEVGQKKKR